jgi:hypothetical protein
MKISRLLAKIPRNDGSEVRFVPSRARPMRVEIIPSLIFDMIIFLLSG